MHIGEKPHECSVCGKKFSETWTLHNHMRTHIEEKPHEWSVSGRKFNFKQVYRHIWELMGVTSHPHVPFVVKNFTEKVFKSHIWVHHKEGQFECSFCGKIFTNNSTRNNHMRIYTGKKATWNVIFVAKNLAHVHFLLVTWGFIVELSPIFVLFDQKIQY